MTNISRTFCVFSVALALVSCGGGGGGSGGGRSTGTGLRVIHASMDLPPVVITVNGSEFTRASYGSSSSYSGVSAGPSTVAVQFQNRSNSVFSSLTVRFEEGMEHTLLLRGESRIGNFRASLIVEEVVQPAPGTARLQFVNGFGSGGDLRLDFQGGIGDGVSPGELGEVIEIPAGPQQISVVEGSRALTSSSVNLPDRGEITVVVSGSRDLGVSFTELVEDLD